MAGKRLTAKEIRLRISNHEAAIKKHQEEMAQLKKELKKKEQLEIISSVEDVMKEEKISLEEVIALLKANKEKGEAMNEN